MEANFADVLEAIFWIVIFLIWLVNRIRKGSEKKKQTPPPLPKSPTPAEPQRSRQNKEETSAKGTSGLVQNILEEMVRVQAKRKAVGPTTPPAPPQDEDVLEIIEAPTEEVPKHRSVVRVKKKPRRLRLRLDLSGQGLRQAVLLREILGPPVALRNDDTRF